MTESTEARTSRKAQFEPCARSFFEINESEPKAKLEFNEKNFIGRKAPPEFNEKP